LHGHDYTIYKRIEVSYLGYDCLRGWWGTPCGFESRLRHPTPGGNALPGVPHIDQLEGHHRNTKRDFGFSRFPPFYFLGYLVELGPHRYRHTGICPVPRSILSRHVAFHNRGGYPHDNLDPLIKPLGLSDEELDALVSFLHSLTGNNFLSAV
jgi:hypothetical protein